MPAGYVHFLLEYESTVDILTFCKNCLSGQNLVVELSKNLKTNQNAGLFKLQQFTNKLRHEVEFLYVIRRP